MVAEIPDAAVLAVVELESEPRVAKAGPRVVEAGTRVVDVVGKDMVVVVNFLPYLHVLQHD